MTVQEYLGWFDDVVALTEPMFRLVPADKLDWKLTPTSFTPGQIMNHIPRSLLFMAKVIKKEELPLRSMREILVSNRRQESSTVDEAIVLFHSCLQDFKAAVGSLGDEQFRQEMIDTPQKGRMLYWRYAAFAVEHHIHHLMELHLVLKALGVKVHTGTLYKR